MGSINLYKIDDEKVQAFERELRSKLSKRSVREIKLSKKKGLVCNFEFYLDDYSQEKNVSWNWVLEEFNEPDLLMVSAPRSVVVIRTNKNATYAVTFGHAYFLADKYCDGDFGFNFARKLSYTNIKTTVLTTPNSQQNKRVTTYIDYNELEFDSGESFAKLKAEVKLSDKFNLYKPNIELGKSIHFVLKFNSLKQVAEIIHHVEDILENEEDKCKIPVFLKIRDKELITRLERSLENNLNLSPSKIAISELDIIGTKETFNNNDMEYELRYNYQTKRINSLSFSLIKEFCNENEWNFDKNILDFRVNYIIDNKVVVTKKVKDFIEYTDDSEQCIFSGGCWYKYNSDYIEYLNNSLDEIEVQYDSRCNFSKQVHLEFINNKFNEIFGSKQLTQEQIKDEKKKLYKKYYRENTFNCLREEQDGYDNYDRRLISVDGNKVELMDLYKDGVMCAVKFGNGSAELCYLVEQSLNTLKLYKQGKLPNLPVFNTVALWIILERENHIEDEHGRPDLKKIRMLLLKNRLAEWKKEVRLIGRTPMIYVNYSYNENS